MTYTPIQTAVRQALLALFAENLNSELARCGQDPLLPTAFMPLPPGDVTQDTVAIGYLGAIRANDNREGLRLTRNSRDNLFGYVVEIWCFGPSDDHAQSRAEACEFAVTQLLDNMTPDGSDRYLSGLLSTPIVIGDTKAFSAEDPERAALLWHLGIPLSCRVRTTRPEQQS
jgi:hypothetical protein